MLSRDKLMEYHCSCISDFYNRIQECKDISILNDMYSYLRKCAYDLFSDGKVHWLYNNAIMNLMDSERVFNKDYLIDNKFYLDINNPLFVNNDSNEVDILRYLVYSTRLDLIDSLSDFYGYDKNNKIWDLYLVNYCELASEKVGKLCDDLGIKHYPIKIYPGYDKNVKLFDGIGYHFFNIVDFGGSKYLLDTTYSQFFNMCSSNLGRIGVMDYFPPNAGCFMVLDDFRRDVALRIISDGYIELSDDVFKAYMDGFTLSFRNGLYYQESNDFSYETPYSVNNYISFLMGQDSQINHEGIEVLGFQKKPLFRK